MAAKKKTEQKRLRISPKSVFLLSGTLLLGVLIGIGVKLAYDFGVNHKKQTNLEPPVQQSQKEEVPTSVNSLPQNFPQDFPVYPDASIKTSWTTQGELKEGISVLWESEDTPLKVADYYKKKLGEFGWSVGSSFESEGSYTISFEKETGEGFMGITRGEGGLTQISVTVGVEIINI